MTPEDRQAKRKKRRREARIRAEGLLDGVVAMLRPGDLAFDCGANVGTVTQVLAGTGATVHAFEPDPVAFAALSERMGRAENVHLHAACVGLSDGVAHLSRAANFADDPQSKTTRSTIIAGGAGMNDADRLEVPQIDLLARLRQGIETHGQIAFLKLDIEGAELDILEAMEAERLFDHIRLTVAETHQGKFPKLKPRFKALRSRIGASYPQTRVFLDWI